MRLWLGIFCIARSEAVEQIFVKLSQREKQCLHFAAQDFSTQEIAEKMHLSHATIKSYRRFILRKLNCKTMVGAACRALEMNLFEGG